MTARSMLGPVAFLLVVSAAPAAAQATNWDPAALDQAQKMLGARLSPDTILADLGSRFRQTPPQMTGILVALGVPPRDFTGDLARRYRAAPGDIARWLSATPAGPGEVMTGLVSVARTPEAALAAMRGAGYSARDGVRALVDARLVGKSPDTDQPISLLIGAGFAALDAINEWVDYARSSPGFAAGQLRRAGSSAADVLAWLEETYGMTDTQAADVLVAAGFSLAEAGRALVDAQGLAEAIRWLASRGASPADFRAAIGAETCARIEDAFRETNATLEYTLEHSPVECLELIVLWWNTPVSTETFFSVVEILESQGVGLTDYVCHGFREIHPTDQMSPQNLGTAMRNAGWPPDKAVEVLDCLYDGGSEVVAAMRAAWGWSVAEAVAWLGWDVCALGGYPDGWDELRDLGYSVTEIVTAMREAGCDPRYVVDMLHKKLPGNSTAEVVAALADAGYSPDEVVAALAAAYGAAWLEAPENTAALLQSLVRSFGIDLQTAGQVLGRCCQPAPLSPADAR